MGVLDDYNCQLRTNLSRRFTSMSSGAIYAAQNRLKGLEAQNSKKQTPIKTNNHAGSGTLADYAYNLATQKNNNNNREASTQNFRDAEQKSKDNYDVYKTLKDAMKQMMNTGHEIDEALLEMDIPEEMLRDNPDMLDDIAKQVADEMAKKSSHDEYEIDVIAEAGDSLGIDLSILNDQPKDDFSPQNPYSSPRVDLFLEESPVESTTPKGVVLEYASNSPEDYMLVDGVSPENVFQTGNNIYPQNPLDDKYYIRPVFIYTSDQDMIEYYNKKSSQETAGAFYMQDGGTVGIFGHGEMTVADLDNDFVALYQVSNFGVNPSFSSSVTPWSLPGMSGSASEGIIEASGNKPKDYAGGSFSINASSFNPSTGTWNTENSWGAKGAKSEGDGQSTSFSFGVNYSYAKLLKYIYFDD